MKKKSKKPQPLYSDSFKLGVVARVVNGEMSKEEARKRFGIGGKSSILEWMRKYRYCTTPSTQLPMVSQSETSEDPEELKKQVQQLEKKLKTERIRSEFYRTMIDVAERELGISIRKKSATNPSD